MKGWITTDEFLRIWWIFDNVLGLFRKLKRLGVIEINQIK